MVKLVSSSISKSLSMIKLMGSCGGCDVMIHVFFTGRSAVKMLSHTGTWKERYGLLFTCVACSPVKVSP